MLIFETGLNAAAENLVLYQGFLSDILQIRKKTEEDSCNRTNRKRLVLLCGTDEFPEKFDAIITDPPYNMKEKVRGGMDDDSSKIVEDLLQCAIENLVDGGRIVFFYPQRHPVCRDDESNGRPNAIIDWQLSSCCQLHLTQRQSEHLRPVHFIRQTFSPTFSRWLVVLEKKQHAYY